MKLVTKFFDGFALTLKPENWEHQDMTVCT